MIRSGTCLQVLEVIMALPRSTAGSGQQCCRLQRTKGVLVALPLLLCAALLTGTVYQRVAAARDQRNFLPPGRLVPVAGARMHLVLSGEGRAPGGPTVVLETGLGGMSSAWGWVQPEVARFARVVSYDRAGLGWSEADPEPGSGVRAARRLHDMLLEAGIDGPYLLVGHSMGGLLVRVFNDLYPDGVCGMVLLDPCHPDQHLRSQAIRRHMESGFRMLKTVPLLTRIGYVRLTDFLDGQAEGLPATQLAQAHAFLCSYQHLKTSDDEASKWETLCAEVRRTRKLGDKPLVVLTAGKGARPGAVELQQELAQLSTRGRQVVVPGADHVTLVTHRENAIAVAAEIRHLTDAIQHHASDHPAALSSARPRSGS
jgi:pimeloyl-ACP methyl ester carboxylesterase